MFLVRLVTALVETLSGVGSGEALAIVFIQVVPHGLEGALGVQASTEGKDSGDTVESVEVVLVLHCVDLLVLLYN